MGTGGVVVFSSGFNVIKQATLPQSFIKVSKTENNGGSVLTIQHFEGNRSPAQFLHFCQRQRCDFTTGKDGVMNNPVRSTARQRRENFGSFLFSQFAHNLAANPILAPFAFPQQDLLSMPVDGNHVHLRRGAPITPNQLWPKWQLSGLPLLNNPFA